MGGEMEVKERRKKFTTISGIEVKRFYRPEDIGDVDYEIDLGDPGSYPFTRGIHETGYRGKIWTMRMFAGYGTPEETNRRFKYLLAHGETGLSTAFDLPTLMGYDTDDPRARGEFGKCGVACSSLRDMEIIFDGIPIDEISTSFTINGPAAVIWAMYLAVAEKRGIPFTKLRGTIQNDILKEFIAQNEFIYPPEPSLKLVVDTFEFGSKYVPQWNTISVSGYHIREAGADAVQELAFTLADGLTYVEAGVERGLHVDEFAPRISFFFGCHNNFFEEIAKFRAARKIWAREMKERFGASPRSQWMRFHTQTAGCTLQAQQPEVNIIRVAIQALAAVLGGTQSLHTNSMDEALALPSEKAALIALRTQQVIACETGVADVVDPLGGSYYIEWLTKRMEERVYEYFEKIWSYGGVIPAIKAGFFHREIAAASYRYQKEVEEKERIIVGVNEYRVDEPIEIPILRVDRVGEERQIKRLQALRRERSTREVLRTLSELKNAAKDNKNLMPYILEAVKAYATLSEICDTLREVYGEEVVGGIYAIC